MEIHLQYLLHKVITEQQDLSIQELVAVEQLMLLVVKLQDKDLLTQ
tara:strand:- start:290 stop:427 length:138 start_codon:yes stop_codon:yes gene_type:complete